MGDSSGRVGTSGVQGGGVGAPASNWFTEWSGRTGVITRVLVFVIVPLSILGMFLPLGEYMAADRTVFTRGQVWRVFTSEFIADSFFAFLFILLFLLLQAGKFESTIGSFQFFYYSVVFGVMINIVFAAMAAFLMAVLPSDASYTLLGKNPTASGLWPVIFYFVTASTMSDPSGRTPFCFINIPNRFFSPILLALFSLLAGALQLDLLIGYLWGVMDVFNLLKYIKPKTSQILQWESQSGFLSRWNIVRWPGYLLLPAGGAQGGDDANIFSSFSMFGGLRGRSSAPATSSAPTSTGGQGRNTASSVHTIGGATAPAESEVAAEVRPAFSGSGQRLGGSATASNPIVSDDARAAAMRAAALARLQKISSSQKEETSTASSTSSQAAPQAPAPPVAHQISQDSSTSLYELSDDDDDTARLLGTIGANRGAAATTKHTGNTNSRSSDPKV